MADNQYVTKTFLSDQFKNYSQVLKEKFVMKGEAGEGESELEHDITCNVSVGNAPSGTVLPQGMTFTEYAEKVHVTTLPPSVSKL